MPIEQLRDFERGLYSYVDTTNPGMLKSIEDKKVLDDELRGTMGKVVKEYKERFASEHQDVAKATA